MRCSPVVCGLLIHKSTSCTHYSTRSLGSIKQRMDPDDPTIENKEKHKSYIRKFKCEPTESMVLPTLIKVPNIILHGHVSSS